MARRRHWLGNVGAFATYTVLAGCNTAPPETSLTRMHEEVAREVAMECWRANEGLRSVHGGGVVWSACLHWAEGRTRGGRPARI
jgi:hypothetical protein